MEADRKAAKTVSGGICEERCLPKYKIRQYLQLISGYAEILLMKLPEKDPMRSEVIEIWNHSKKMDRDIRNSL
ncbi:MAG: hypothetical protein V2I97_13805 [Desulfococcaceae bacterium]|jgi:hypothetical protein|nr:hypothetical protein [Desulfococcaceae bacterium]